jgi:hypothetical protein
MHHAYNSHDGVVVVQAALCTHSLSADSLRYDALGQHMLRVRMQLYLGGL